MIQEYNSPFIIDFPTNEETSIGYLAIGENNKHIMQEKEVEYVDALIHLFFQS